MFAARVRFKVMFEGEAILPPFTSKACKTIVIKALEASKLSAELPERKARKPYAVTPLFKDGRALIKEEREEGYVTVKPGETYEFELRLVGTSLTPIISSLASAPSVVEAFQRRVLLAVQDITFKSFESMGIPEAQLLKLNFLTPALLKLPKLKELALEETKHSLFPQPSLMIYSLALHWNKYAPDELKVDDVELLAKYADYALMEVDYGLKPFTAVYDEKRRPRGFVGWTLYKLRRLNYKLHEQLTRLLDYANYVGIGRSRSIGFGVVKVEVKSEGLTLK